MDIYCLQEWELSIETMPIAFINKLPNFGSSYKDNPTNSGFGYAFLSFLEGGGWNLRSQEKCGIIRFVRQRKCSVCKENATEKM